MSTQKKTSLRAKLLLLASTIVFLCLLALAGEISVRLFSNTTLMGNSRNLFVANAHGTSKGNTPNVEAISFAEPVFTDRYGFRVPESYDEQSGQGTPALLLLGDSVGFGTGVMEERSFAGLLRTSLPELQVYNSSVVGHGTPNYLDVVKAWLPEHPEVQTVVLHFCLNDVSSVSARQIDAALGDAQDKKADEPRNYVQRLRDIKLIGGLNAFLRSRSELYLAVRNVLTDPQRRYWDVDKRVYRDYEEVAKAMQPIAEIADSLTEKGIRFVVILSPHEYQLRPGVEDAELELPQQQLATFLGEAGIKYADALPYLRESGGGSSYFLGGDPMHLSDAGHEAMHSFMLDTLSAE